MPRGTIVDMLMRRDGRNPYGSRGGYVDSRRTRYDRNRGDYNYEYGNREPDYRMDNTSHSQYDSENGRRDYERGNQYDMGVRYPFMVEGEFGRYDGHYPYMPHPMYWGKPDHNMDYGKGSMPEKDLEEWTKKLEHQLEEKDKPFFTREHIKRKAEEMGIKFDKFSIEEFVVTCLMMYTDYCKTLGSANMDIYVRLAKDWICDEDVAMKYGEKLTAYYDYVVDPIN